MRKESKNQSSLPVIIDSIKHLGLEMLKHSDTSSLSAKYPFSGEARNSGQPERTLLSASSLKAGLTGF